MNKLFVFLYIIALCCFILSVFKTKDTLYFITTDVDSNIYLDIGHKKYSKESTLNYYKQALRYILYFVFFIDVFNLEEVI